MYRFLLAPRWLALHLVVLLAVPAFLLLGKWQFGRYEMRSANQERTQANLAAPAVPLDRLSTVGGSVDAKLKYRAVTVRGRFDPANELLVRRRTLNGKVGYHVLTRSWSATARPCSWSAAGCRWARPRRPRPRCRPRPPARCP